MKFNDPKIIGVLILGILVAAAAAWVLYFKNPGQKNAPKSTQANTEVAAKAEAKMLSEEISKFLELPEGEQAVVMTVSDVSKLSDQPFFRRAKNGDKVLYYPASQRAFLYDPVAKKILDIGFLNFTASGGGVATPSATP